jgi:hypothetical protein
VDDLSSVLKKATLWCSKALAIVVIEAARSLFQHTVRAPRARATAVLVDLRYAASVSRVVAACFCVFVALLVAPSCGPTREECNTFPDTEPSEIEPIDFSIVNASDSDLFYLDLPGTDLPVDVELIAEDGTRLVTIIGCAAQCNCEALTYDDDDYGACAICEGISRSRLVAGETDSQSWNATQYPTHELSADCVDSAHSDFVNPNEQPSVACYQSIVIPPGTYVLRFTAFRTCNDCDCTGAHCQSGEFSDPVTVETTFTYPSGQIELEFE